MWQLSTVDKGTLKLENIIAPKRARRWNYV
jgi:hypothetical protein